MSTTMTIASSRRTRIAGYAFGLCAGAIWGTTGPLSQAAQDAGVQLTDVGFWRVLLASIGLIAYGLVARDLFRVDRRGWLLVAGLGGLFVALFEVAFQYAFAGIGVAPTVALLYTAPIIVAVLAHSLLGEALTPVRIALAVVVMVGVTLTVNGEVMDGGGATGEVTRLVGIVGGLLSAASFAGTTILARFAVPRYGAVKVLFLELLGGTLILGMLLPLAGKAPALPVGAASWICIAALSLGAVLAANFFFFAAVKRIDAAPTAVAASIEPLVGALLALLLFNQQLRWFGWLGLLMVIAGVAGGYKEEAELEPEATPL